MSVLIRTTITLLLCLMHPVSVDAASSTDLPIPRFVSLRADEANVRSGPGTRYPIQWVYHRQGLPIEIIEEYDAWRKIRDIEGTVGWIHQSLLAGSRHAIITGKEPHMVRLDAEPGAKAILKVGPDVVVHLIECQLDWCQIKVSGRKGWIEKHFLWGVYPREIIE